MDVTSRYVSCLPDFLKLFRTLMIPAQAVPRPERRQRALSLLSVCSTNSLKYAAPSSPSQAYATLGSHAAKGVFIPPSSSSASSALRLIINDNRRHRRMSLPPAHGLPFPSIVVHPPFPSSPLAGRTTSTSSLSSASDSQTLIDAPFSYPASSLDPILASVEQKSKFCRKTMDCSNCRKSGVNFPRCPRCGDMWCSRECRVGEGKRHVCSTRTL